jgi:S-(hydroxymethyl)glutathione dehydrogenase/alcohol dehydrogenase
MASTGRRVRAAVAEQSGEALRIEELLLDAPRPGELLVRMAASGVCHSDLHVRDGEWQRPGPVVLGHEGAGIVEAVGPGVTGVGAGQLVALTWYAPCGRCRACAGGRPWLCSGSASLRHRLPDGRTPLHRADGQEVLAYCGIATFGEAIVVPAAAVVPMPDGVTAEVAALIGCCVSTGVGAVRKTARVPPGASVVVLGLGGVGLSAVMGAVLAGAGRIVAVDRVAAKLERARELGATHAVLAGERAATDAAIREASGGDPDYVVEAIGLRATIEQAIELLPPGGTAVLVGMTPFGERASFEVFPFVDGARSILGSNYGATVAAEDFRAYAELHLAGSLPIERLIDHRIRLEDLEAAFERMRRGEGVRSVILYDGDRPAGA